MMRFAIFLCFVAAPLRAAEPVDYLRDIKPLLTVRCLACHGALQQKAELRVDTVKSILAGGNNGPALVPGRPEDSSLLERITLADKRRMPPESEGEGLTAKQIALVRDWIAQGAKGPTDEKPEADPRDHWAFRPPVRPISPTVRDTSRMRNPIDAFLAVEREKRGIALAAPADRKTLLRRLYLDLIGLPPTRDELAAFAESKTPDADYERIVERLLASPRHGERWGRHAMDQWRYSDWWGLGAEVRNSQKHIWHWRDWIIESLNADKGYDAMLREMLAADELFPDDLDRLRATGFLARQYFKFNRNSWLDETVEHTGKAFLGLTLNCARCHDHKYDPVSQADYFRFRAFFEPYQVRMEMVPGQPDFEKDGIPRAYDCNLDAPTYRFVRGDEKHPVTDRPLAPGLPGLLALGDLTIRPVSLPATAHSPALRHHVLADQIALAEVQIRAARTALKAAKEATVAVAEKALATAETRPRVLQAVATAQRSPEKKDLARAAVIAEREANIAKADEALARAELEWTTAEMPKKADAEKKRNTARDALAAARKMLDAPGEAYTPLRGALKSVESTTETEANRTKPFPTTSTGRRSALAAWLTDRKNPLTARVAVNQMWLRHFGTPLVPTVFDFGRKGTPPTHPELLDWLAVEFMDSGWSLKHLHRLMVSSEAYRLTSSAASGNGAKLDPENRSYWRARPIRMDAQTVRDSLLHLAGDLDTTTGGPDPGGGRGLAPTQSLLRPFAQRSSEVPVDLRRRQRAGLLPSGREHPAATGAGPVEQQVRADDGRPDRLAHRRDEQCRILAIGLRVGPGQHADGRRTGRV